METIEDKFKTALMPLYEKLLKDNTFENISTFCIQWGKYFPKEEKTGILFIGKAINGWITDDTDINILFGDSEERIFAREDQMEWVHKKEGSNNRYNTKTSAFWRVIKQISQHYFPTEWYSYVAWSNLCKIAPSKGGNPNNKLYYEQLDSCRQILSKEIEILSPKAVVMLTSGWDKDFLYYLNDNIQPKSEMTLDWYGYQTILYKIKGILYISSPHPQGKSEDKHIEAIIKLIG